MVSIPYFRDLRVERGEIIQVCHIGGHISPNTKYLYNICTTSAQRLRPWSSIVQKLYKCFVFTVIFLF